MIYKSQKSITDKVIPEVSTRSVKVSEPSSPEVQVSNTSGIKVLSFPKDHKMIMDEIVRNELFGKVEVRLNSSIKEKNPNKEQGDKKGMLRSTWKKEVSKLVFIKSNEQLSNMEMKEIKRNIEAENSNDIDIDQPLRKIDGDRWIKMDVAAEVYRIIDTMVEQDVLDENAKKHSQ